MYHTINGAKLPIYLLHSHARKHKPPPITSRRRITINNYAAELLTTHQAEDFAGQVKVDAFRIVDAGSLHVADYAWAFPGEVHPDLLEPAPTVLNRLNVPQNVSVLCWLLKHLQMPKQKHIINPLNHAENAEVNVSALDPSQPQHPYAKQQPKSARSLQQLEAP